MKRLVYCLVVLICFTFIIGCGDDSSGTSGTGSVKDSTNVIKIGYNTSALINGQLGQVFIHTNILEQNNLKGEVKSFADEKSLLVALKAGTLDAALTFDFPAILSLANGFDGLMVGTLGVVGRNALVVSPTSPIKQVKDLNGQTIGVTFNSAGHRDVLGWLRRAGLKPGKSIELINLNESELIGALQNKSVAGVVLSDPNLEKYYRQKYQIRADSRNYSLILIRRDYRQKNPSATANFVSAVKKAIFFANRRKGEVNNKWFAPVSGIKQDLVWACSATNSNYNSVRSIDKINLALTDSYLNILRNNVAFIKAQKIGNLPDLNKFLDAGLKKTVEKKIDPAQFKVDSVKVK